MFGNFSLSDPAVWMGLVVIVMQMLDGWTTYTGIKYGAREEWPPMKWLMGKLGVYGALVLTKGGFAALTWGLATSPDPYRIPVLAAIAVVYFYVVSGNWDVLQAQRAKQQGD